MKNIFISITAIVVLVLGGIGLVSSASANESPEPCVPQEAYTETTDWVSESPGEGWYQVDEQTTETVIEEAHWQRYSWTGGPHDANTPPPFPSSDWQPNVKGDPHGVGVEGAYFRSHGNSGKGDWFYLEWVEAVTETTTVYKFAFDHPEVVCEPTDEPTPTDPPTTEPPVEEPPTSEPPVVEPPTDEPSEPTEPAQPNTPNTPNTLDSPGSVIEHKYTCTEHIAVTYVDGELVGTEVVATFPNTCAKSVKQEGM